VQDMGAARTSVDLVGLGNTTTLEEIAGGDP
jgi:hypothetical protein